MTKRMTEGKPISLILSFALPMLLGNIFQQIYNLVDTAIVGRFVGTEALAAVGAAGSTTFLLFSLINGLSNGAGIIIAQYFGYGDEKAIKKACVSLEIIGVTIGLFITILGLFITPAILKLLKTPADIFADSSLYVRVIFAGILATALYNCLSSILRSIGDSKTPLYALIAASLTNIGLDLLFVICFKMGVFGVALATIIAQIVSVIICIIFIQKKHPLLQFTKDDYKIHWDIIKKIFALGIPTALQSSLIALSGMCVQSLINSFGSDTIAAYTAANKIDSIAIQMVVALGTSMATFTSQNIGAGYLDRVKLALKQLLFVMILSCIGIAILIVTFRVPLLSLFLDSKTAGKSIAIGSEYLTIVVVAYVIAGIMQSFLNLIRGAGDVNASMLAGIVELSARVIFAYILSSFLGSTGIWIATPLSWGCACLYTICRYFSGKWKTKAVV